MLRLYNTLSNAKEEFHPLEEGVVRLYTCGPTVYDFAHIGNFRTFTLQDLLVRYLRHRGLKVIHVMNITDVDDKIIKGARVQGVQLREYTERYIQAFLEDSRILRLQMPDLLPRATDHIDDMVALIRSLESRGVAYRREGSIYFRIARFPGYGKLSKKDFSGALTGASVDADEYDKEDARDFVLWKAHKEGEDHWETELGPGRPGWHIECSAMSMKYLGETFDIHCGGVDLVFPHHENEIAQSEAATGKPLARYWIHPEFLLVEGEKMSKSRGNHFTLRDLLAQGHSPEAIRYLYLSVQYRKQLNFTMDGLRQAQSAIQRLEDFRLQMSEGADDRAPAAAFTAEVDKARNRFLDALDDDLNTPAALASVFDFVRTAYQALQQGRVGGGDRSTALQFVQEAGQLLGILRDRPMILDAEIARRIEEREEARRRRDFPAADRIREGLLAQGIQLEDTRDGTRWKRIH